MKRYLCCVGLLLCLGCEPEPSCVESSTCKSAFKDGGANTSDPDVDRSDVAADVSSDDARVDRAPDRNDDRADLNLLDMIAERGSDVVSPDDARDIGVSPDVADGADTRICDTTKRPGEEPCLVDEKYGVFVSPHGDDIGGSGSRTAPYLTLSKGIAIAALAGDRRVYVCDDGAGYAEQVVLPTGAKLYGGFNCDKDWTYGGSQRAVVRAPASPALAISSGTMGVLVEDFEFIAPDASDPDASTAGSGASSIAAIIDTSVDVVLRRVRLVANKAGDGANGVDGDKGEDAPDGTGIDQQGKNAYCALDAGTAQLGGAWGGLSKCGSKGGNGGAANQGSTGSAGVDGTPVGNTNGGHVGMNGAEGATGATGSHGNLAAAVGVFSAAGYAVATGGTGVEGKVGQGGGGGAASSPPPGSSCLGASGGAGGMGGCGGKAGTGGTGGGASLALISLSSGIVLDTCTLVASNGGAGGKGGNGAVGGFGKGGGQGGLGSTGNGIPNGNRGGLGGDGGTGGAGAGGSGGPSYAIVTKGNSPTRSGNNTLMTGIGGAAGIGGSNSTKAPDGSVGLVADEFTIP